MMDDPHLKSVVESQPYPLVFVTISGAHLYGFPSPDSDYDLRGVHVLPLGEVVGLDSGRETIESSETRGSMQIDLVTHDAKKFFRLLLKRNGYALEQLTSPLIVHASPEHDELRALVPHLLSRHHSHHYLGFAETQWALFEKTEPRPVKPLLYVFRVLLAGIHLMQSGEVEANLVRLNERFHLPYIPDLVERKISGSEKATLANAEGEFFRAEYVRLLRALENAASSSKLPDLPSARPALHDLLLRLRLRSHGI